MNLEAIEAMGLGQLKNHLTSLGNSAETSESGKGLKQRMQLKLIAHIREHSSQEDAIEVMLDTQSDTKNIPNI